MTNNRKIKVITFDLDNTLWDTNTVIYAAEEALYQWLQQLAPQLTAKFNIDDLRLQRLNLVKDQPELRHQVSELRIKSLYLNLVAAGYEASTASKLSSQAFDFFYAERQKVKPFPRVEETLSHLKENYRLGSITNGNANLAIIGLEKYFDFSLSAEQVGANKPSEKIFSAALNEAQCLKHELIHVGDHPTDDIVGAKQFGFHAIWTNYLESEWAFGEKPTQEINQFNDIIGAIKTIELSECS